jgi:hypothetical protein
MGWGKGGPRACATPDHMHSKLRVRRSSRPCPILRHPAALDGEERFCSALGERFPLLPGARGASSLELGLKAATRSPPCLSKPHRFHG